MTVNELPENNDIQEEQETKIDPCDPTQSEPPDLPTLMAWEARRRL